jgi:folate-binding protein YgfZ
MFSQEPNSVIQAPAQDMSLLHREGGFCRLPELGLIEVYGADATRFLQAQTTNDLARLAPGQSQKSALLDRKAHVQAIFDLYRHNTSYRIVAEKEQIENIISHLEAFHFADKVEFLDCSQTGSFFAVQGPKSRKAISEGVAGKQLEDALNLDLNDLRLWKINVHVFKKSLTGDEGYLIWVKSSDCADFERDFTAACRSLGLTELTKDTLEVARVEAGMARFGVDFDGQNILPETGYDDEAVSYTKGCFQGQEVLARIKNQGAPTRALIGLMFPQGIVRNYSSGTRILVEHEGVQCEAATIKSIVFSQAMNRMLAIASIKRDYRVPGQTLSAEIDGEKLDIAVTLLPFRKGESASVAARELLERALLLFTKEVDGAQEKESNSIALLRQAIELDPGLEDAYEALGVILSRRERLDEAIAVMKHLVELNPDSVMAHTNLSVFYVDQGRKEEAEEEKAISMSIRMRLAAKEASQALKEKEEAAKKVQEAGERLKMFEEVLAIDADDLLANYGVGSCLVALEQYADAVQYLKKALSIKPSHTVAYVSLAEAFIALNEKDNARETLKKGIEVASKRGDMTPLKDMQARLAELTP